MKKLLMIMTAAILMCSCSSKDGYTIKGDVAGLNGPVVLVKPSGEVFAETTAQNGKFTFKGTVEDPTMLILSDGQRRMGMFFLENGKIRITKKSGDFEPLTVKGTVSNNRYNEYLQSNDKAMERFLNAEDENEREAIMEESDRATDALIEKNLDNIFGMYLLSENGLYRWQGQDVLNKINEFSEEMRVTNFAADITGKAEEKRRTDVGQKYIEISLPDKDGKEISLTESMKGKKYIMIDFWASWCPPCMREVPYLVEAYEKYAPKGFEIYAVSSDRDYEQWQNTIQEYNLNWIQVINTPTSTAKADYFVMSIPTNLIIDSEGTIVARNLRGKNVERKLAELLD